MSTQPHCLTLNFEDDPVVSQVSDDQENLPEWLLTFGELTIHLHQRQLASLVHQFLRELGYDSDMLDLQPDEE